MKDILQKQMAEMQTKRMAEMEEMKTKYMAEMEEMKTVIEQQRAKHMAEMEEMKTVIEQQRAIVEQQRAWMDNLILTLKNFMKHEEQEQEKQQGEQEQEQVQRGRSRCRGRSSRRRSSSPSVQGDPCRFTALYHSRPRAGTGWSGTGTVERGGVCGGGVWTVCPGGVVCGGCGERKAKGYTRASTLAHAYYAVPILVRPTLKVLYNRCVYHR